MSNFDNEIRNAMGNAAQMQGGAYPFWRGEVHQATAHNGAQLVRQPNGDVYLNGNIMQPGQYERIKYSGDAPTAEQAPAPAPAPVAPAQPTNNIAATIDAQIDQGNAPNAAQLNAGVQSDAQLLENEAQHALPNVPADPNAVKQPILDPVAQTQFPAEQFNKNIAEGTPPAVAENGGAPEGYDWSKVAVGAAAGAGLGYTAKKVLDRNAANAQKQQTQKVMAKPVTNVNQTIDEQVDANKFQNLTVGPDFVEDARNAAQQVGGNVDVIETKPVQAQTRFTESAQDAVQPVAKAPTNVDTTIDKTLSAPPEFKTINDVNKEIARIDAEIKTPKGNANMRELSNYKQMLVRMQELMSHDVVPRNIKPKVKGAK